MAPANLVPDSVDVIIIGAGPVGLTTANLLGQYGVSVLVAETRDTLIDYPRGVGMDDETLRTFQTIGLAGNILPHVVTNQLMRIVSRSGRVLAELAPPQAEFGWPRRNGFIQPLIDRELRAGLARHDHVAVRFSTEITGWEEKDDRLLVTAHTRDGSEHQVRARYLVGADGGRSFTRHAMGVSFDGQSNSTRWLVVDLNNDPLGHPNSYLGADPRRPYVSIALPHGVRRFEFMLFENETDGEAEKPDFVRRLMSLLVPGAESVDMIRARVYTHHSRIASSFRQGRVMIAGDAAHLMPVWQGQGFNSGVRDASNLAWKLALVVRGSASPELLDTYDAERRDHALAMINLSTLFGRFISPTSKTLARLRDGAAIALGAVPSLKAYVAGMKFKPMPKYTAGAIVPPAPSAAANSPVGKLFIQPKVATRTQPDVLLDEVTGDWLTLVAWNNNPAALLDDDARSRLSVLGVKLAELRPLSQLHWDGHDHPDVTVIGDSTGALKKFFDAHPESVLLLRPDRVVAAACPAYRTSAMVRAACRALHAVDVSAATVPAASEEVPA